MPQQPPATMKSSIPPKNKCFHAQSTKRPGHTTRHPKPVTHPIPDSPRVGKRILLVEDDPTVRGSLKDMLVGEGYFVIPAENGQQALDLTGRLPFDLVLLDLNMPVKDGWDTFGQLTADYPFIPIIITTGRPSQLFTAIGAGAGALLEKPIDIPTLLQTMEKLLAEPAEKRLARLAGVKTDFYYQPTTATHEWPLQASFGSSSMEEIKE